MRRILNGLYGLSALLAGIALTAILLTVLAQVSLNFADWIYSRFTGVPIGLLIPSYADFAGYFLVGATFFALASSFHDGAHVRVNLFLQRLPEGWRRAAEIASTAAASALTAFFLYHAIRLTHDSWRFNDLSRGLVAIRIWIPQAVMCAGIAMLLVACLDALVTTLMGGKANYRVAEEEAGIAPGR